MDIQLTKDILAMVDNLPYINNEYRETNWKHYNYYGIGVPRVSSILETCIAKPYLINWAASLGSLDAYKTAKFQALDTGSLVHEMIEDYLIDGYTKDSYKVTKYTNELQAQTAYWNYREFERNLMNNGFSLDSLMLELECVGPLYGGTIDFVANINNITTLQSKTYILDFKSSNAISLDYLLQTMLYTLNINYLKSIGDPFFSNFDIQGIGIIRIDKNRKNKYQYLLVDFEKDKEFIDQIAITSIEMVKWFYNYKNYEAAFKDNKQLINKEALF